MVEPVTLWKPADIFEHKERYKLAVIVLKSDQDCPCVRNTIKYFWKCAQLRVIEDKAASLIMELHKDEFPLVPHIICGGNKSMSKRNIERYHKLGIEIVVNWNDYLTDFMKCCNEVANRQMIKHVSYDAVVALGGLCGRTDHMFGTLQTLFLQAKLCPKTALYLWHAESVVFLLQAGKNKIEFSPQRCTGKCGLIPLRSSVKVTTTGLRENFNSQNLAFEEWKLISNEAVDTVICIHNSDQILFSFELKLTGLRL